MAPQGMSRWQVWGPSWQGPGPGMCVSLSPSDNWGVRPAQQPTPPAPATDALRELELEGKPGLSWTVKEARPVQGGIAHHTHNQPNGTQCTSCGDNTFRQSKYSPTQRCAVESIIHFKGSISLSWMKKHLVSLMDSMYWIRICNNVFIVQIGNILHRGFVLCLSCQEIFIVNLTHLFIEGQFWSNFPQAPQMSDYCQRLVIFYLQLWMSFNLCQHQTSCIFDETIGVNI